MELTHREQKAVERLKKLERRWPWLRWCGILIGLAVSAVGIHYLLEGIQGVRDYPPQAGVPVIAFTWAVLAGRSYLLMWFGFWLVGWILGRWNGDPKTTLLLKLLDETARRK